MIVPNEPTENMNGQTKKIYYTVIATITIFIIAAIAYGVLTPHYDMIVVTQPSPWVYFFAGLGAVIVAGIPIVLWRWPSNPKPAWFYVDVVGDKPDHYQLLEKDVL